MDFEKLFVKVKIEFVEGRNLIKFTIDKEIIPILSIASNCNIFTQFFSMPKKLPLIFFPPIF